MQRMQGEVAVFRCGLFVITLANEFQNIVICAELSFDAVEKELQ